MFLIKWGPYCWKVSIDSGKTWENLESDNEDNSSEAVYEAAGRFGIATNKWELVYD